METAALLRFGPFVLDPYRRSLQRDGEELVVGARALSLFEALLEADGGVVGREALLDRAWPGTIVEESNLSVQIATLRKILGTQPDGQEWIATVPRIGYRLSRPVEAAAGGSSGRPSVAILPFNDFSEGLGQGYFADGIVEDMITALSRFKTFAVVARNSSFVYKGRAVDIRDVAKELGVRYVLEGSVRRADRKVRVTTQLIDATTGAHIWAEKFDGALDDIFDVQDRITESVIGAIEPQIRKVEIERSRRKRPESLDAYDLYLQALPLIQGIHGGGYGEAIDLLERAIVLDPGFAPALALGCWAHAKRIGSGVKAPPGVDDREACIALAQRALAADSDDAMVLAIAGIHLMTIKGDGEQGYAVVARALALNPNSLIVNNFGGFAHRRRSNFDAAIACHLRALQLSPGAPEAIWSLTGIAGCHLAAGRFEETLTWAMRSLETHDFYWTHGMMAAAYAHLGRADDAHAALAELFARRPDATVASLFNSIDASDRNMIDGLVKAGLRAG